MKKVTKTLLTFEVLLTLCLIQVTDSLQLVQNRPQKQSEFQVYGQSVIGLDGSVEKSLAAVIRVPRHQPANEMPNDEPETSSGKHHSMTSSFLKD